jgi:hypothetical protein
MTYTASKAQAGRGTILSIGSTPVVIGEITSEGFSGNAWKFEDVSNMQSGQDEEFIPTMRDNGTYDITGNRVSSDAGQVAVENAYYNTGGGTLVASPFLMTLLKNASQTTSADTYAFNAFVQSVSFKTDVEKKITWEVKLKISGAVTKTVGS